MRKVIDGWKFFSSGRECLKEIKNSDGDEKVVMLSHDGKDLHVEIEVTETGLYSSMIAVIPINVLRKLLENVPDE